MRWLDAYWLWLNELPFVLAWFFVVGTFLMAPLWAIAIGFALYDWTKKELFITVGLVSGVVVSIFIIFYLYIHIGF